MENSQNFEQEYEIDLLDMLRRILLGWRKILLFSLIGAVLVGGVSAFLLFNPKNKDQAKLEEREGILEERSELKGKLSPLETVNVEKAVESYKSYLVYYDNAVEKGKDSVYLNLDPAASCTGTALYELSNYHDPNILYVAESSGSMALDLVNMYSSLLTTDGMLEQLGKDAGLDCGPEYVKDLIKIVNGGVSLLSVTATAENREQCEKLLQSLDSAIMDVGDEIRKVTPHDISYLNTNYNEDFNYVLADAQKAQTEKLSTLSVQMMQLSTGFSADQKAYYNNLLLDIGEELPTDEETGKIKFVKPVMKRALIGFAAGLVLCIGIICCAYIFVRVLRTSSEMESAYLCYVISTVKEAKDQGKKKILSGIDRYIEKLFDKHFGYINRDEALKIACQEIAFAVRKKEKKKLYIMGTYSDGGVEELKSALTSGVEKELGNAAEIRNGGSIIKDAANLKDMLSSDAVVIVEKTDCSSHKDIAREMLICRKYGVNVIGSVILATDLL